MNQASLPIANPTVVFREEFDDWAVLFDPDTGNGYGLDPVGVFLWKLMDGSHTVDQMLTKLESACEDGVPEDAAADLDDFVKDLHENGLIGYA